MSRPLSAFTKSASSAKQAAKRLMSRVFQASDLTHKGSNRLLVHALDLTLALPVTCAFGKSPLIVLR
jgi:hypothetical protein